MNILILIFISKILLLFYCYTNLFLTNQCIIKIYKIFIYSKIIINNIYSYNNKSNIDKDNENNN